MEISHQSIEWEQLRGQLQAGEYKSSADLILDSIGTLIQKISRRTKPPASWVSAVTIALLIALIAYLSALFTGEMSEDGLQTILYGAGLIFVNLIIAKEAFRRTFKSFHEKLFRNLKSNQGIKGLVGWLEETGNLWRPALLGLIIYITYIAFLLPDPTKMPIDVVVIEAVIGGVLLIWSGFIIYYMCLFVVLPLRLSQCNIQLHREDPVNTEVLDDWSRMINFAAYMFAIMLAAGTLFTISIISFNLNTLYFVIPRWLPLIAIFAVNQITISGLITKSKRETLNEIEAQMGELRSIEGSPDKEKLGTLLLLWDYHDRIKNTRNSALDINGLINFVNTLLIPIAAFLLANRKALLELLN